jgi:hypothetical protein
VKRPCSEEPEAQVAGIVARLANLEACPTTKRAKHSSSLTSTAAASPVLARRTVTKHRFI